jgi:hypothetical protein
MKIEEVFAYLCVAAEKTGFDHADFSRIRNADLGRFTIDRL